MSNLVEKLRQIISGWFNLLFQKDEIEIMARKRKETCLACPHIEGTVCTLCGCPLPPKTRAVGATCPDNRWTV